MNSVETVSGIDVPDNIVDISGFRGSGQERMKKQQRRIHTADERFAALDEKSQRYILCHIIGYIEASNNLISSGKRARSNEISSIFEVMENMINKSWNGGMI